MFQLITFICLLLAILHNMGVGNWSVASNYVIAMMLFGIGESLDTIQRYFKNKNKHNNV